MKTRGLSSLQGLGVLVTRAKEQAASLNKLLESKGAIPYSYPLIQTQQTRDINRLDTAIRSLQEYQWLVFTSMNGVHYFMQRCAQLFDQQPTTNETVASMLAQIKIAAVGPKTKRSLEELGLAVEFLPPAAKQEELAEELCKRLKVDERVLIPTGQLARPVLRETLQKQGVAVDVVEAYETLPVLHSLAEKQKLAYKLQTGEISILTFTSPSTVNHFFQSFAELQIPWSDILASVTAGCIGPITAQRALEYGLEVQVQAEPYTVEALVEALEEFFAAKQ